MNDYKIFIQRLGLVGIVNILVGLSGIIFLPLLTKNLSLTEYGLWVQISVTIDLIPAIVTLGLPFALVRFLPSINDNKLIKEEFFSVSIIVFLISILFSFFIFVILTIFFENFYYVLLFSAILFFVNINLLSLNFLKAFQMMKLFAAFLFIQAYLVLLLVYVFFYAGYGFFGVFLSYLITQLIITLIFGYIIYAKIGVSFPKFTEVKKYLSFGLPFIPWNFAYWIVTSSDRYIISLIMGSAFVGIYSPGYSLGCIIQMLSMPFATLLLPVLSRYHDKNDINNLDLVFKYSFKYFLIIAIPAFVGISLLSKNLLLILTTVEIADNGYLVTPFIALSTLFYGCYTIFVQALLLKNKTKISSTIWILGALINIILNFILIPILGIIGAALTTLISYLMIFICVFFYSRKYIKIELSPKSIFKVNISSLIMACFILIIDPIGILQVLLTIIFGALLYFVVLFLLGNFKKNEINFIKNIAFKNK